MPRESGRAPAYLTVNATVRDWAALCAAVAAIAAWAR
jgi:hypothetical protein